MQLSETKRSFVKKIEKKASGEYYLDANIYLIIVTPGVKHMAKGVET